FCDWYIELAKADVTAEQSTTERDTARSRLITVLEQALRLLHPFMPYITEELWQRLPGVNERLLHPAYRHAQPTIMLTAYPQSRAELIDERAEWEMRALIDLISRVRNIRSEVNIKPAERVRLLVSSPDERVRALFAASLDQIARLTRASDISLRERLDAPRASARAVLTGGAEVAVPLEGLIDFAQEHERLGREREKLQKEAAKLEAQLANPQFAERAPAEKVNEIRGRLADIARRMAALQQMLEALR
ncbi:MAG TPA: class I tRNA ligase family protein, partial [Pyrinomonadaceae bacterium]|nr:class I tRNA ligase family protein [Pyrinomonadaceae bacterium]